MIKIVTQRVNGYVEHWKIHQVILQMTANNRVLETFDTFKPIESRLKIVNKLVDILINDDIVEFDPMATLQEFKY